MSECSFSEAYNLAKICLDVYKESKQHLFDAKATPSVSQNLCF